MKLVGSWNLLKNLGCESTYSVQMDSVESKLEKKRNRFFNINIESVIVENKVA